MFIIATIVLVGLAACGKSDEEQVVTPEPHPVTDGATTEKAVSVQPVDGAVDMPDMVETLKEISGVMTPEQKQEAIARARHNAEDAAKAVGQTIDNAKKAGDAAQAAAVKAFDTQ